MLRRKDLSSFGGGLVVTVGAPLPDQPGANTGMLTNKWCDLFPFLLGQIWATRHGAQIYMLLVGLLVVLGGGSRVADPSLSSRMEAWPQAPRISFLFSPPSDFQAELQGP